MREGKYLQWPVGMLQTKIKGHSVPVEAQIHAAPFTYLLHVTPYTPLVHSIDLAYIGPDDPN